MISFVSESWFPELAISSEFLFEAFLNPSLRKESVLRSWPRIIRYSTSSRNRARYRDESLRDTLWL